MGKFTFSNRTYTSSVAKFTTPGKKATSRGEEIVKNTGKLDPLIDPAGYGVIRPSRIRLNEVEGGGWIVPVGAPGTKAYRLDTTGSMGNNVERAILALPQICGLTAKVMPGRDTFFCAEIFADCCDKFVLCRGHFEVVADRMVNQLTLMNPESGGGGNGGEDPQYGIFGATYLTDAYLQKIGLKTMDFTITDEPMHPYLEADELIRVFGPEVFDKVKENGFDINQKSIPSNKEMIKDMLTRVHAFVLLVDGGRRIGLTEHWQELYGKERVVILDNIDHVPHVMATITGLTEGTLDLLSARDFLTDAEISKTEARQITDSIAHIPLGAQCALPNYAKLPKKGDYFLEKTDLWPVPADEVPDFVKNQTQTPEKAKADTGGWL